ncbi:hypothetical protein ES707_00334 [subsurface metagenome]
MRDSYHDLVPEISLKLQALTTAKDGENIIDLQGFESARIDIYSGTITDGDAYTFELKEGSESNLSDAAAVADENLLPQGGGAEPVFATADGDKIKSFGYVGTKRYLRLDFKSVTGSPATGGLFVAAIVKGHPRHKPAV